MKKFFRKILRKKTKRERYEARREKQRVSRAKRFKAGRERVYWRHFLAYVGHYKLQLTGLLAMIFIGGVVGVALPQIARFILNTVVPKGDMGLLNLIVLAGFGIYALYGGIRYIEQKLVVTFSMNLITEIRRDLFSHQLRLPLTYFEKYSAGKLISKLTYSIMMIKLLVETFAYVCIRELVLITMLVVVASIIDFRLTLIFLGLSPLFILYIRHLNRFMSDIAVQLQTKNDQILKVLDRAYNSVKLFQVFGEGSREVNKFEKVLNEDKFFRIKRTMVYNTNAILIITLTSCVILGALWYGGRQIILGNLTHGDVVGYMICLAMLFRPVSEFVKASAYLQAGKIGVRAVFSIYENTTPIEEPEHPLVPARREGKVEFRNIWFQYGDSGGSLKNVSFCIQPRQKVLIVGRSGSGKSTIFNLLLRLYESDRGSILIDGLNIRRMRLRDLRNYYSIVTQDQLNIEDSILSNVMFGSEEKSESEQESSLEKAMEVAQQTDMNRFVTSLKKKYRHKISAGGGGFSRGEMQKIAMMRAVTKEAPIILLDEPTASLDAHSERSLLKVINEQFKEKTILMISHRPVPQYRADWIIVMKNGFMENQGTHHYLIKHSSYYRHFFRHGRMSTEHAA